MEAFSAYVSHLDGLVAQVGRGEPEFIHSASIRAALDCEPNDQLRRLVSQDKLRSSGAFFTGSKLAHHALGPFLNSITAESVILDPACGAGDLLIKCAQHLISLQETGQRSQACRTQVIGRDLHPEFIKAARARLTLQALSLPPGSPVSAPPDLSFPELQAKCGLTDTAALSVATHIVLNPPFNQTMAPASCSWAKGKVSAAALFLENCLTHAKPGTQVLAILPDALRSGSRYKKWRELVESRTSIQRIQPYGQFDDNTDIDVFILQLQTCPQRTEAPRVAWFPVSSQTQSTVGDFFEVSIGPVVDYRDLHMGQRSSFLRARGLPAWKTLRSTERTRRFSGRTIPPPFVVVRRTSRPGDRHRAIGTIISISKSVAVENHLVVLSPKDGTLRSCRALLKILKQESTTEWLDQRIRCRHLTVSALADLPWWSREK